MAVKTRTALQTQNTTTFKDQPAGNITPPLHRTFNNDLIDSAANLSDSNAYTGVNTFNATVNFKGPFNTAYSASPALETVDLSNEFNFVEITTEGEITSFGENAEQGSWRYLRFNEDAAGTLITNNVHIICPLGQDIVVEAGDTCMVWAVDTDKWAITNYNRADGSGLNSSALVSPYYSKPNTIPDGDFDITKGYGRGDRFLTILANGEYLEYVCVSNTNGSALWIPMQGTMYFTGGTGDVSLIDPIITFNNTTTGLSDYNIRYELHGKFIVMYGYLQFPAQTDNIHPDGTIVFPLINDNDGGIKFTLTGASKPSGMATISNSGAVLSGNYAASIDSNTTDIIINVATENPHWGSVTAVVNFTIMADIKFL